ncbi:MAG TPA: hypothetical protein VN802_21280 [Stellaceae bacterium]|nr:hypothetical protein [Stellaceae bacterium]
MTIDGRMFAAMLGALALLGCSGAPLGDTNTQQRGISTDIDASLNHGPTAGRPGMIGSQEPVGAFPWEISGGAR